MKVKIAAVQMDVKTGHIDQNLKKAEQFVASAAKFKPNFLAFPEMFATGFAFDELKMYAQKYKAAFDSFFKMSAKKTGAYIIGGSVPEVEADKLYNTCFIYSPEGKEIAKYRKVHPFPQTGEDAYFEHGKSILVLKTKFGVISVALCYDLRFPELIRAKTLKGAEIIFVPAQFPKPRSDHWEIILRARAIENQIFVVGVNRIGGQKLKHFGKSMVINPNGKIMDMLEEEEGVLFSEIDLDEIAKVRDFMPHLKHRKPEVYKGLYA
ncbi:MAG: carbon-nitrogen family hydrolase [Candidatus Margulisbacteria bacterium]|nr:carbon-nitrogen family hydrolase [Candidatus Margulisiibacteriota bacterium]MBU1021567.1 carbon-nitrogen family hydrolase [Candidatus Margulisiibacteriota bacterium]MBU1728718.1 carbon-nitrogen family hydrolase [Candidatus Margulisiibacteriota bacterium]MBU1955169.1 carbon-nitrogen family hydrolase [Candidatus Margulisiibacteriota bacterium]